MPAAATGMALFLQSVGQIVTAAITWMGSYIHALTASGNEMLLFFLALPLVGTGIGLIKRLISIN